MSRQIDMHKARFLLLLPAIAEIYWLWSSEADPAAHTVIVWLSAIIVLLLLRTRQWMASTALACGIMLSICISVFLTRLSEGMISGTTHRVLAAVVTDPFTVVAAILFGLAFWAVLFGLKIIAATAFSQQGRQS